MAYSRSVGQGTERRTGAERPLELQGSRPQQGHAEFDLRGTYPIDVDDLRSPLEVEALAQHRIAPYVLEPTRQDDDRWTSWS
jgi:hypothetical protein